LNSERLQVGRAPVSARRQLHREPAEGDEEEPPVGTMANHMASREPSTNAPAPIKTHDTPAAMKVTPVEGPLSIVTSPSH
jgi:hypothetical protein